jgi:hypothetical protein
MPNETQIQLAIASLESGEQKSLRIAATTYGVSKSVLHDRMTGKHKSALGRVTILSETTEQLLVQLIVKMSDIGFSLTRNELLELVTNYLKKTEQTELFKNSTPTKNWYYSFIKRHRATLTTRKSNNMPSNRARSTNVKVIDRWFDGLKLIYDEHNFYEKPCHVWNTDESGYQCDQGRFKVLCRRGSKAPTKLGVSNDKTTYTILACCSAQGGFMPIHTVYKGFLFIVYLFTLPKINLLTFLHRREINE